MCKPLDLKTKITLGFVTMMLLGIGDYAYYSLRQLAVQSQGELGEVLGGDSRLFLPLGAHKLGRGQAAQAFAPFGVVGGQQKACSRALSRALAA